MSSSITIQPNKAFTLIELSIVLVIIGLIVGGVLVGKDLINAAKVRNVISEQEQIKVALNTFKLKYNCIPGDCNKATMFFSGVMDGDGDGKIELGDIGSGFHETQLFWRELALAGLIQGEYSGKRAAGPQAYIFGGANATDYPTKYLDRAGYNSHYLNIYNNGFHAGNVIWLNSQSDDGSPWAGATVIPVRDARGIDVKLDDGKPGMGKVISQGGATRSGVWQGCHDGNNLETIAQQQTAQYMISWDHTCTMYFNIE